MLLKHTSFSNSLMSDRSHHAFVLSPDHDELWAITQLGNELHNEITIGIS